MKIKRNSGFSLAEMLIVVAIIIALLGVAALTFQNQQRSMTRLEFDTIAKEIYIAAQNHLTAAQTQGYLQSMDKGDYGTQGTHTNDGDDVWYVINSQNAKILNRMLPSYAIDPTVLSGSYIIRYQPSVGRVLDVFYSREIVSTFLTKSGTTLGDGDYRYDSLMDNCRGDDKRSARQRYGSKNAVIGWYGDEEPVERGERLAVPSFDIINAEQLYVKVNDPNNSLDIGSLKLIVTGVKSGAEKVFTLVKDDASGSKTRGASTDPRVEPYTGDIVPTADENVTYTIVLDDITTAGMQFKEITSDDSSKPFLPGEDLKVKVVAYSNTKLANIAMSEEKVTNSLFADPDSDTSDTVADGSDIANGIAGVANIRHLENLDEKVSEFAVDSFKASDKVTAKQLTDMSWPVFKNHIVELKKLSGTNAAVGVAIYYDNGGTETSTLKSGVGYYYPVSPAYILDYDGQRNSITDVKADFSGNAGLFGTLVKSGSAVSNLKLINFEIVAGGSGDAGALVGHAGPTSGSDTGATITNVVAYNTAAYETAKAAATPAKTNDITAAGSAGGLIGSATNCTVQKCAAALIVNGGTNAGGLIGTSSAGSVTASYSGGHTSQAAYYTTTASGGTTTKTPVYNVTATGTTGMAGGLIGDAGNTTINYSYSTCSANGETAGGFVGSASGDATNIQYCYATGLVNTSTITAANDRTANSKKGAFAASAAGSNCLYYGIINEVIKPETKKDGTTAYPVDHYLGAVGDAASTDGITEFDLSANTYNTFSGAPGGWETAYPYDPTLTEYYGAGTGANRVSKFNLKTVSQLGANVDNTTDFVAAHYGDWPAPELFIINK